MRHLIIAFFLLLGTLAHAQDNDDNDKRTPEERAKHRTEEMTKDLGLSADQSAKVADINLRFAKASAEAKQLTDEKARKERKRALKATRDNEYKGVLTAEQFTKLMQQRDQKKDDGKKDDGKKDEKGKEKKPHNE